MKSTNEKILMVMNFTFTEITEVLIGGDGWFRRFICWLFSLRVKEPKQLYNYKLEVIVEATNILLVSNILMDIYGNKWRVMNIFTGSDNQCTIILISVKPINAITVIGSHLAIIGYMVEEGNHD